MHKRVYTVTLDIECWDDLKVEKSIGRKASIFFPTSSSILAYKSGSRQDQWTKLEVAQLKLTGQLDCGKLHPNCYRRLQILFSGSGSVEGFPSVLPQTLVFVINSL